MSTGDKTRIPHRQLPWDELARVSDEALMGYLRDGNCDALAVLFDRYHLLVMNVALRILRDEAEAEDLMQSVFLEIFRSVAQYDSSKGSTKVWILQYAYHRSFNRRQHLKLRSNHEFPEEYIPSGKTPDVTLTHRLNVLESARAIRQALACLNGKQRKVLELAFYEGLTMHEIAQMTTESFDSIRHHYYRGLEKLRSILCKAPDTHDKASATEDIAHVQS